MSRSRGCCAIHASVSRCAPSATNEPSALRILVTVPRGDRLGGAEAMLHTGSVPGDGSSARQHTSARAPVAGESAPPEVTIVAHDVGAVGGMELVLAELISGLRRLGHRVTVIARTCELPPDPGIVFHRVRGPARPLALALPWFMLAGTLAVSRRRR